MDIKVAANILTIWIPYRPLRRGIREFLKSVPARLGMEDNNPKGKQAFMRDFQLFRAAPEQFELPCAAEPEVSIILPAYNQYHYTHLCLWSILQNTSGVSYEVILADDCSTDETEHIAEKISNLRVVRTPQNLRFLKNCNHAAQHARGKYILFLNNDTQVQKNWLKPLVDVLEKDPSAGLVGSQLLYPDKKLQEAGGIIWQDASGWNYGHNQMPWLDEFNYLKEVDYISGCSIMLKTALWKELGGFDEAFAPAYYEDTDLAFRIREKGLKVIYQPLSKVIHFEGKSNGTDLASGQKQYQVVNARKFAEKWANTLKTQHAVVADAFYARDRSMGKKVLLFIDHLILTYDRDTGSRASLQYLQFFVDRGYKVIFLPHDKCPRDYHLDTLRQMGIEVLSSSYYNLHWDAWLEKNGQYIDYVYLNRPDMADAYLDGIQEYTKAKVIYQGHDLHYLRFEREYELSGKKSLLQKARRFESLEKGLASRVDAMLFFSQAEVDIIRQAVPDATLDVVPLYVIDTKDKADIQYEAAQRKDILFVGGYKHIPNVDAAQWLAEEVMPLVLKKIPDMVLHLIGSNAPASLEKLASKNVLIRGYMSDEDLDALYQTIKLAIVPTRFGAGVKGKVLEAIYNKVPVVTTTIGAEGIPNDEGILTIRDTAQEMADAIVRLYTDDAEAARCSDLSHPFLDKHYSCACVQSKFQQWMEL